MAGKFPLHILYLSCAFLFGTLQIVRSRPFYSLPSEQGKYSVNNRAVFARVYKPLDDLLEAALEFGGKLVLIMPQKDSEKRDPDFGTGRSYSGQHTVNVMWGQLASNSPTGPGRRRRNSIDGGTAIPRISDGQLLKMKCPCHPDNQSIDLIFP